MRYTYPEELIRGDHEAASFLGDVLHRGDPGREVIRVGCGVDS